MDRKIAVQLRWYEPWESQLEDVAKVGFKYVSFCFEGDFHAKLIESDWEKQIYAIREKLERYGLKCVMTHAPCYDLRYSAETPEEGKAEEIIHSVKATRILGADLTAIHTRSVFIKGENGRTDVDREKSIDFNVRLFSPAVEEAEKQGVLFGIENLPDFPGWEIPFCGCYPEDHAKLIDAFGSKNVCAIWDFGHSNINLVTQDKAEAIRILGNRIKGTHVHNNRGHLDLHYPPSCGNIDWKSVMGALRDTGYDGYLTLETIFDFNLAPHSYMQHLYDCIEAIWDKYFIGNE